MSVTVPVDSDELRRLRWIERRARTVIEYRWDASWLDELARDLGVERPWEQEV